MGTFSFQTLIIHKILLSAMECLHDSNSTCTIGSIQSDLVWIKSNCGCYSMLDIREERGSETFCYSSVIINRVRNKTVWERRHWSKERGRGRQKEQRRIAPVFSCIGRKHKTTRWNSLAPPSTDHYYHEVGISYPQRTHTFFSPIGLLWPLMSYQAYASCFIGILSESFCTMQ